jgi:hypothetical protein
MVEDESFFFSFFKKNVGNFSSFAFATNILVLFLVSSLFFKREFEGAGGKIAQWDPKKQTFSSTPVGTGRNGSCKEGRGGHEKCFVGDEREKK